MSWKRKVSWVGIAFGGVIVLIAVAGYVVLTSPRFHKYLLTEIERQVSQSIGTNVRIQDFSLQLARLAANVYGITIEGSDTTSAGPLVQADQLTIQVKIVSLLHREIDLSEIILRHPVVNLRVRKDGSTNLPTPPESSSQTSRSPFDLGIQHVLLERGEIYYNDVKTPLDAELHQLQVEIRAGLVGRSYDGSLSYRDGRVRYGSTKPLPHDLTVHFNATPSEFTLNPMVFTVASSTLVLNGQIRNYSQPSANMSYKLTLHPQDAASAVNDISLPVGEITLAGSLRYEHRENVPLPLSVAVDGRLNGGLAVNTTAARATVSNAQGEFELLNGNLNVRRLEADLLGGHVTTTGTIQHLEGNSVADLRASAEGISINDINVALRSASLSPIPVEGQITGTAQASWTGSLKNIRARSDATLKATLTRQTNGPTPIDGAVHLAYEGRSTTATLTNTFVRTPSTQIQLSGTAGPKLDLNLQAHASDLKEVGSLVDAIRSAGTQQPAPDTRDGSMNFGGAADIQVTVRGTTADPRIQGQLAGRSLQVHDTQWRSLDLKLEASKSGVSIRDGSLVNARQGYVNFEMSSGLSNWRYLPSGPVTVDVKSRALDIKPLLQAAGLDYPASGILSADLSMHGSQLSPEGSGSVRLTQANVYGQPLQQLSIQSKGNGDSLTSTAEVTLPAGAVNANLTFYPKRKGYELQLDSPGISLGQLQAVREKNLPVQGTLSVRASGRGTVDDPQLTVAAQIVQLQVRNASISGIKGDINIANHEARLALDSEVAETPVQVRGTVSLDGGHYVKAALDTKGIPIERLIALYGQSKTNGPRGIVEVHASAEGPLNDKNRIRGEVTIPTLKADYQGLQIGNTRPIHVRYADSVITFDPTEIAGTDSTLQVQGQLPLKRNAPATLTATGNIDMQLLRLVQPDLQSSGKIRLDVHGAGSASNPSVQGQLRVENVSITPADSLLGVQNLNGVLDISNDRVTITQFAGESGGGQISARGTIGYRPQVQMNVGVNAKSVRIRYQDAVRAVLEGDLSLTGTTQAANLNGRVLIDNLSFTQNFDIATFAGQVQSGPESAPTQGFANNVKLDVVVQTGPGLNLTSSEISLQGQANLHVVGTAADPVITGRTEFTAGDIFFLNKRYQIERGIIEFPNPHRTQPVLNVRLTTKINQYNLSLLFRGPLDRLQTSYVSDPALPTADIINLIARGQTSQQAAASPSNFGASSLLAQGAASQVSSQVQKLAGLSSLSIDPTLGGNNSDPGARIAMQKRVTNNFLFTFATDVTSTQRELIQGEYQFNRRWSASATRDENGGFAVDGKYHRRY